MVWLWSLILLQLLQAALDVDALNGSEIPTSDMLCHLYYFLYSIPYCNAAHQQALNCAPVEV